MSGEFFEDLTGDHTVLKPDYIILSQEVLCLDSLEDKVLKNKMRAMFSFFLLPIVTFPDP